MDVDYSILAIVLILLAMFMIGHGINTIANQNWSDFQCFCVGMLSMFVVCVPKIVFYSGKKGE